MKCSLGISSFLEEISSLSCSIIFLYFFALITEEGFTTLRWTNCVEIPHVQGQRKDGRRGKFVFRIKLNSLLESNLFNH